MTDFFSPFSGSFPLSKTLRFALLPQGDTLTNFQKDGILQRDEQRRNDYQAIKPLFNQLHDQFITTSLAESNIDWSDFFAFYGAYKQNPREEREQHKAEFTSHLKHLREEVVKLYSPTAENWKITYLNTKGKPILTEKGYKILTESKILEVMKSKFPEHEALISRFGNFFTYFSGFNQNRENYYSSEEKSTSVAHRIVNENLIFFCDNAVLAEKLTALDLLTDAEKQIFNIPFYNQCLTQDGIDKYNVLIGTINSKINLYKQENQTKLPFLKELYKCIGSLKARTIPFIVIETDDELKTTVQEIITDCDEFLPKIQKIISSIITSDSEAAQEQEKIRVSKTSLTRLSNRYFKKWYAITEKGGELGIFKKNTKKDAEEKFIVPDYLSVDQLKQIIDAIDDENIPKRNDFVSLVKEDLKQYVDEYMREKKQILLSLQRNEDIKIQKDSIKNLGDQAIFLFRFLKVFRVKVDAGLDTSELYNEIDALIDNVPLTKQYDAIRNYLTKKPFSEEKMKLNFDCSTLLGGRDVNKETQNLSVILRKNGKFYLAIIKKENNTLFDPEKHPSLYKNPDEMEKLEYKLLPGPNKMLPKVFFSQKGLEFFKPSEKILNLYQKGTFKKGPAFNVQDLHTLIDFYKAALGKHEERGKTFKFSFQSTSHYEDISQFYAEVEQQGYKLSRKGINSSVLEQFVEEGKCYLFEISCKDFIKQNPDSKDSLQAVYWKNMFTPHSNIKLNGEAEIFFRPASLKEKHQVQTNQYTITNEKAIKSGRYTEDRFLFHCPITLHFGTKAEGKFNQRLNQHLKPYIENGLFRSARNDEGRQMHIIGVDRGEKHLNFYSVINMQGKIVEQGTLNIVNGTNYETLLSARATERNSARQNRDTIGSIKDLKDGYISQVVHQLANLVLKYNAVIVLEDLNSGFKRGRQKIEKSVYQKLELALAKKLSYFVCKGTPAGQSGSATNAYQLCPLVSNFGDIKGKQWGILFYTRANYTSTTDPISGWRKNLYLKKGKRDEMKKQILNFTKIAYDNEKSAFYFTYNPRNFSEGKGLAKERTLRSNVERWRGKREDNGQRNQEMVGDITEKLKNLFSDNGLDPMKDILPQIKEKSDLEAKFYSELIWLIDAIMQIRNTSEKEVGQEGKKVKITNDFILSPVEPHFDSRERYVKTKKIVDGQEIFETENKEPFPTSGDANGAFNIARKGLMMLKRIAENPEKPNLFISDEEWDEFANN